MQQVVNSLPSLAGVYQYFNEDKKLLYIGKAKDLKKRVKSYWRFTPNFRPNENLSLRILKMLNEAKFLEYIVVNSEEEALILENSLIKQLKPKYNILLRDDKTYPYIYIDNSLDFPRFEITRRVISNKNINYYGPFSTGAKELLSSLYDIFPLVQKKSCIKGKKACLFYQIKKCLAPCEGKISKEEYLKIVNEAKENILKRKTLIEKLEIKMFEYSKNERFEEAIVLRDKISKIKNLVISSTIDIAKNENSDIFAIDINREQGVIVKIFMREGKIISSSHKFFKNIDFFNINDAYKQILLNHYTIDTPITTQKILVSHKFDDIKKIEEILSKQFSKKISIINPQRGNGTKLIALAKENAKELLKQINNVSIIEKEISSLFKLDIVPYRVESFDNSHLMGENIVGAMVVYENGKWDKKSYRKYTLKERDEYGQMREMLLRRVEKFKENPPPDLWIIDGGETNLNLALSILKGVNLEVIAISKAKIDAKVSRAKGSAKDILYSKNGVLKLNSTDKRLIWIQKQRDEVHRFAIKYHRKKRAKEDKQISLLTQKGIGEGYLKKLIAYFGTFEAIKKAPIEELKKVVPNKIAYNIIEFYTK